MGHGSVGLVDLRSVGRKGLGSVGMLVVAAYGLPGVA